MTSPVRGSYLSTFEHSFDAKGRITVPSDWRGENHELNLHVFPSKDGCLKVYPESWLARQIAEMATLSLEDPRRKQIEALSRIAQAAKPDAKVGRMMVREGLRRHAGLGKEAVLVGSGDHFEVWDKQQWTARPAQDLTLEDAAAAAGI
ncbi:MAG: division/cell wall cluster transcriptional repressor MraZ [Verrucomicrobiota bacterium]